MKITKADAKRQDWDNVRSWNYKLTHLSSKISVVYAELDGVHGEVNTKDTERIYYIIDGEGEFEIEGEKTAVTKDMVITVPANARYNYQPLNGTTLKVLLLMELWDN